jgi:hypothetical protein
MTRPRSKILYKFLAANYAISAIKDRTIKVARVKELNDPFEFLAYSTGDRTLRSALNNMIEESHKIHGIISFSLNWNNPVLWSHYADCHRGIVLGFELADGAIEDKLIHISYSDRRLPPKRLISAANKNAENGWELLAAGINTKFKHWEYESEGRLIVDLSHTSENERGLRFLNYSDDLILRKIIVGFRSEVTRAEIAAAVRHGNHEPRNGVQVTSFKARPAFQKFRMVRNRDPQLWK